MKQTSGEWLQEKFEFIYWMLQRDEISKETAENWRTYFINKMEPPNELESVLAEIYHNNDLGLSKWYEVVYYDDGWYSYAGSKTFQDGEQVVDWKYCKDYH
jgi:hypothetical protein